jgi:hypothetical protein
MLFGPYTTFAPCLLWFPQHPPSPTRHDAAARCLAPTSLPSALGRARTKHRPRTPHATVGGRQPATFRVLMHVQTRSPCAHPPGIALARPAPPRASVVPNSRPSSRPHSRRVKPCSNSTAGASSQPCWVGSPSPAAQASWLQQQRTRPRPPALPPRHRRRDQVPSKRRKSLWSGRVGGDAGGAGGAAAVAFAAGAGSWLTPLPEAGEPRRAGAKDRRPARGYADDR